MPMGRNVIRQARINELERRAVAVGIVTPHAFIVVGDAIDPEPFLIDQPQRLAAVGELALLPSKNLAIKMSVRVRIGRNHEMAAWFEDGAVWD